MQLLYSLLGWTGFSYNGHRGRTSECLLIKLIVVLLITGHLLVLVSCEGELKKEEEGHGAPEDPPSASAAGGSPQQDTGGGGGGAYGKGKGQPVDHTRSRSSSVMDPALLTSEYSSFDGDGMPGTQEEFKIEVPPAKEECFFQWMKPGTKLLSSFQVLRGADLNLDFTLRNPEGVIMKIEAWTNRGSIASPIIREGVYALCLGNNMSKFSRKLVHIFFQTEHAMDSKNYTSAIDEYETEVLAITKSLQTVQSRIPMVKASQASLRMNVAKDQYNIRRMKETVQKRSIIISVVIVVVAVFQVFFLRRLFKATIVTPSSKPRA